MSVVDMQVCNDPSEFLILSLMIMLNTINFERDDYLELAWVIREKCCEPR